jgi:hypothetical protein
MYVDEADVLIRQILILLPWRDEVEEDKIKIAPFSPYPRS